MQLLQMPKLRRARNRIQQGTTDHIIATIVWILDIGVKPVGGIIAVIMLTPKLGAVSSMPKELSVQRNRKNTVPFRCYFFEHLIVFRMDGLSVLPVLQHET